MNKTGYVAITDSGECGHHHKTWGAARECLLRFIALNRDDFRNEAKRNGESYGDYINRFVDSAIYYRNADGNLTHNK